MDHDEDVLIDAPLVPDPDEAEELASGVEAIADEDLQGSRLLVVRWAAEPIEADGSGGGVIGLSCTFQPADGARFSSAQLLLSFETPKGLRILDVQPREVIDRPVKFAVDKKGTLSVKVEAAEAAAEAASRKEFAVYHCSVQGSGAGTARARWNFRENPHRRDGLGGEQLLVLSVPVTGRVSGIVGVTARLKRAGFRGRMEAVRDMVLGVTPQERRYPLSLEIPRRQPASGFFKFLRVG